MGALWRHTRHRVRRVAGASRCARPDDGTMTLRLARAPSVDAAKRGSVLLLLPGGPGVGIRRSWAARCARRSMLPNSSVRYGSLP